MSNPIDFENQRYFSGDLMTIFDTLNLSANNSTEESSRVLKLALYDLENMLPRAIGNLQKFYTLKPELRKDGYDFLANKIAEIEKMFQANKNLNYNEQEKYLQILKDEIDLIFEKNNQQTKAKLTWKGKPAHLALIIDTLIEKGYLEATPYGERTAKILLSLFDFQELKPTIESLGKLLHKDKYAINDKTVVDQFNKIPKRSELK